MARAKRSKAKSQTNGGGNGSSHAASNSDGETTGRYVVIFKEGADLDAGAAKKFLANTAGISSVASADDYEDSAVAAEDLHTADGLYFPSVGVAIVSGVDDAVQNLSSSAADSSSPISVIEPEYKAYALSPDGGLSADYLRGFRDAADRLFSAQFLDRMPLDAPASEMAAFQDTAQLTWGLQATRVATSKFSGSGIKVAVLDTGLDLLHPDFKGRPVISKSFIQGQSVQDENRHGTHCIGTSCGPKVPPSGVRRYGIAFGASIFAGKVLSNLGSGSTAGIVAGIEWALANACHIVSMSLGANINQKIQQYEVPIARALARGTLVIAAAGNNANRALGDFGFVGPPANADAAMAVAALDSTLGIASFSARSSLVTGVGGKVNVAGPGVGVFSSVPTKFGGHALLSGTSMATPHVAGIAALWAQATGERGAKLWTRIEQSARPLALPALDVGFGLVQAPQ